MAKATTSHYDITVSIVTFRDPPYLEEVIRAVMRQQIDRPFELLIVDSGLADAALSRVHACMKQHENIRLHTIPNSEFGHGKTRNLIAQLAKGEYVVYLTEDAIPAHNRWLYELTKPFEINERIVGVMGKQIPRPHCIPMLKYEIQSVFGNFGPDFGTTVFYKDDFITSQSIYDMVRFYSDVNSVARKSFLLDEISYRDVNYAEDQLFGQDLLEAGYLKAYAGRGAVVHSNDLKFFEYKKRMFDETMGLRRIGIAMDVPGRKLIARMVVMGSLKDTVRIVRDREFSWKRKLYWLVLNPLFHVQKWRGVRLALTVNLADENALASHSLEKGRRAG